MSDRFVTQNGRFQAIVIGASAGAIDALSVILPVIPRGYSVPVLVVVHLPPNNDSVLVDLFRSKCRIDVKEAEDKESMLGGTAYFAPPNYHLLVEPDGRLSLSSDEPVLFSRPAIDVLFESAADVYGARLIGIVLTGANNDGANGLRAICEAGGLGIVQRPDSAHMPTMPRAALAACPAAQSMTVEQIAEFLTAIGTPTC